MGCFAVWWIGTSVSEDLAASVFEVEVVTASPWKAEVASSFTMLVLVLWTTCHHIPHLDM